MDLLRWIDAIDKTLVIFINNDSDHIYLDPVMLLLRNPYTWTPLYVFMAWHVTRNGKGGSLLFILFSLAGFAIADSTSVIILKPFLAD